MKLSSYITICVFIMHNLLYALPQDEEANFLAKDRENSLKITNYKSVFEEEKKQEELLKQQELEKQQEEQRIRELKLKKEKQAQEEALKKAMEQEQERQAKQRQKEEIQSQKELAKKQRVSKLKVVNVLGGKDVVDFKANLGDEFFMEDYAELGTPQDTASSVVNRDNLATTDMYIRLLLETNINSRRAGEFVAVVEKDVFSYNSKQVLIPKGSKFICSYEPLQAYGETALLSECKRVYFPNGKSMLVSSALLSDVMGRAGIIGDLDNRMWEKYGQTLTLSVLSGGAMLGADKIPNKDVGSLAQYTALNVVDLSTKFLEKTIDLAPVVTIPSGSRVILKLAVDINLNPIEQ